MHASPNIRRYDRRRGQTLAEFAITLPILLILLFGILEFGRMFQSWVTLQNAARSAARYAVTGQYDSEKYDLDFLVPCLVRDSSLPIGTFNAPLYSTSAPLSASINIFLKDPAITIPTSTAESAPLQVSGTPNQQLWESSVNENLPRRVAVSYYRTNGDLLIKKWDPIGQQTVIDMIAMGLTDVSIVPINEDESLYATWYSRDDGVNDCYPSDDSLQYRKDLLRLASIYDEARRGAAGLQLEPSLTGSGTLGEFNRFLQDTWSNPSPRQDTPAWFNVMICSARQRLYADPNTSIVNNPDDTSSMSPDPNTQKEATLRFYTYMGDNDGLPDPAGSATNGSVQRLPGGGCILKEAPTASATGILNNYNTTWADAGGAGDRLVIVVTYNHPLITPLGLARYVQMQARRAAVNESFKVTSAERVLGPSGNSGPQFVPPTARPPTDTPTASATPLPTDTPTWTPSPSPTATEGPFDCTKLSAGGLRYDTDGRSIVVVITNDNTKRAVLSGVVFHWLPSKILPTYPDAYYGFSSMNGDVHWVGNAPGSAPQVAQVTPIDTANTNLGTFYGGVDTIEQRVIEAYRTGSWKGTFLSLPDRLGNLTYGSDFNNTTFVIHELMDDGVTLGIRCEVIIEETPPPPTDVPNPNAGTGTPTHTPDCADRRLTVSFVSFESQGSIRLRVTNMRSVPGYFIGFTIYWPTRIPGLALSKVSVGGSNVNDYVSPGNPSGAGTLVWQNSGGGTDVSPALSTNASHGTWVQNYVFPPNSITDVFVGFSGVGGGGRLDTLGIHQSEFNGTVLRIRCNPTGGPGGGGGGGGSEGDIGFDAVSTPNATNTVRPTNTPGPTPTPSKTPLPVTPSATWTQRPPTATFTASPSPGPTNTPTKTPPPTPIPVGCTSGC